MVTLPTILASNSRLPTDLPANLTAIFVGATSGIGLYTLRAFASHARRPRVYFIGRSQSAGERIAQECEVLNPEGSFTFVRADMSVLGVVDEVCERIKAEVKEVNVLFMSQGTLAQGERTSEGLTTFASLAYHSRLRFALNLLPLLRRAGASGQLSRVVTVLAGSKEGPLDQNHLLGNEEMSLMKQRGHGATMMTLAMGKLAEMAPEVGFVHDFPGVVRGGAARGTKGVFWFFVRNVTQYLGRFFCVPDEECGERHVFLATSSRYAAPEGGNGTTFEGGSARGIDGKEGSGAYAVDDQCESAAPAVQDLLAGYRTDGTAEKLWKATEADLVRASGKVML